MGSIFTNDLADNEIEQLGHPGKWKGVVACAQDSTTHFTGSQYGAGACFIKAAAGRSSGTTITFGNNSTITADILFAGGDLGAPGLVEASIRKVVVADTSNAEVYVLQRNFQIR